MKLEKETHEVIVEEYRDGFSVTVDGEEFYYKQEDSLYLMIEAFNNLVGKLENYIEEM